MLEKYDHKIFVIISSLFFIMNGIYVYITNEKLYNSCILLFLAVVFLILSVYIILKYEINTSIKLFEFDGVHYILFVIGIMLTLISNNNFIFLIGTLLAFTTVIHQAYKILKIQNEV